MSRSGYSEDCDNLNLYRGTVARTLRGKRGQQFLRELIAALDALPEKILIAGELITEHGECCAIGAVCKARSLDVSHVDYYDPERVGNLMGISSVMAAEIAFENDEAWADYGPELRWKRMREWATENLIAPSVSEPNEVR